jgi:hypothetical protein
VVVVGGLHQGFAFACCGSDDGGRYSAAAGGPGVVGGRLHAEGRVSAGGSVRRAMSAEKRRWCSPPLLHSSFFRHAFQGESLPQTPASAAQCGSLVCETIAMCVHLVQFLAPRAALEFVCLCTESGLLLSLVRVTSPHRMLSRKRSRTVLRAWQ